MSEETTSGAQVEEQKQGQGSTPETVEPAEAVKPVMIPKERLDAEIQKRKALEKAAAELEALKQAQADDEARRKGDVEKFTKERDQYKSEAEQWRDYATTKLGALAETLDDAGRAILEDLGEEVPLHKRIAIAEKLASQQTKKPAGFGTNGGSGSGTEGGVIPSSVQDLKGFHAWWQKLLSTPEGRAQAADPVFNQKVTAERLRRFR